MERAESTKGWLDAVPLVVLVVGLVGLLTIWARVVPAYWYLWRDVGAGADVGIVVTAAPELNCGGKYGGCFNSATPDTIYVGSGLSGEMLEYVVLHEYGHVLQDRAGVVWGQTSQERLECSADAIAIKLGANPMYAAYINSSEGCP